MVPRLDAGKRERAVGGGEGRLAATAEADGGHVHRKSASVACLDNVTGERGRGDDEVGARDGHVATGAEDDGGVGADRAVAGPAAGDACGVPVRACMLVEDVEVSVRSGVDLVR